MCSEDIINFSFAALFLSFLLFLGWYVSETPMIYEDRNGNPVACNVDGQDYAITHTECRKALKHKYVHTSPLIWQGTCNKDGNCTLER